MPPPEKPVGRSSEKAVPLFSLKNFLTSGRIWDILYVLLGYRQMVRQRTLTPSL